VIVSWAFWVVKNPAPRTTYEKTAATTTKAMSTIAASRPVNASFDSFIVGIKSPELLYF
jgi:hypothetical protein